MTAARKLGPGIISGYAPSHAPKAKSIGRPKTGERVIGHGLAWRERSRNREDLSLDAKKLRHALSGAIMLVAQGEHPSLPTLTALLEQVSRFVVEADAELSRRLP